MRDVRHVRLHRKIKSTRQVLEGFDLKSDLLRGNELRQIEDGFGVAGLNQCG